VLFWREEATHRRFCDGVWDSHPTNAPAIFTLIFTYDGRLFTPPHPSAIRHINRRRITSTITWYFWFMCCAAWSPFIYQSPSHNDRCTRSNTPASSRTDRYNWWSVISHHEQLKFPTTRPRIKWVISVSENRNT
jgi:hypothetical protein